MVKSWFTPTNLVANTDKGEDQEDCQTNRNLLKLDQVLPIQQDVLLDVDEEDDRIPTLKAT